MIRMIACDVDGTLLQQGQTELSPQVFEQIVRLQAKGIRFCPASGRQYSSLQKLFAPVADQLYYVCENGAVVFGPGNPGKLLAKQAMERTCTIALCHDILAADQCEVMISGVNLSYGKCLSLPLCQGSNVPGYVPVHLDDPALHVVGGDVILRHTAVDPAGHVGMDKDFDASGVFP